MTLYVERYHNRVKSGIGSIERRSVQTEEESYYIIAHYDSLSNCLVSHSQLSPIYKSGGIVHQNHNTSEHKEAEVHLRQWRSSNCRFFYLYICQAVVVHDSGIQVSVALTLTLP